MAQKIKFRRGTAATLATIIPENGEPCWTTDTKKFAIGDGTTQGGVNVSSAIDADATANLSNKVITSGVLTVESDGLQRLRLGDSSIGGRILNNPALIKFDTSFNGKSSADDLTIIFHPNLVGPVKDSTYYNLDAYLMFDVGASSTGFLTPTMQVTMANFTSFQGHLELIQNISSTAGTFLTGIASACLVSNTAITLPGTPSGTTARSICRINGVGVTNAPGVYAPTGKAGAGIQFAKTTVSSPTVRIRQGSHVKLTELTNNPPQIINTILTSGGTIFSGGVMFAEAVCSAFPAVSDLSYYWRANGSIIPTQTGFVGLTGFTPPFAATGFTSGTLFTCAFTATNSYGSGSGVTDACKQIT